MNRDQIEQAAKEYCRETICIECGSNTNCDRSELGWCLPTESEYDAFLAGAEFRQAEIDSLTADCERYKTAVDEGLRREGVARNIIAAKRNELYTLKWSMFEAQRVLKLAANNIRDVTQGLQKYNKS
jgi:hypothetical protein